MSSIKHLVLVAAENGALPGGKVGGVGDVIEHLPKALVRKGCQVTVITPSYGSLQLAPGAQLRTVIKVPFAGGEVPVELYQVPGNLPNKAIRHWVLHHPNFATAGQGVIYANFDENPFSIDASKFALFSQATAELLLDDPDNPPMPCTCTIGTQLFYCCCVRRTRATPPYSDCTASFRFTTSRCKAFVRCRVTLRLCRHGTQTWMWTSQHRRTTPVGPTASTRCGPASCLGTGSIPCRQTTLPKSPSQVTRREGFSGGEGLDADLRDAKRSGRLHGILNGCDYPTAEPRGSAKRDTGIRQWSDFLAASRRELTRWAAQKPVLRSSHFVAGNALADLADRPIKQLLTSVTRVTDQKISLLLQPCSNATPALDNLLNAVGDDCLFVLLGSGQGEFEHALTRVAAEHSNFLFLNGYSDTLANALYERGDLFLMPSSFEPCGISQMIAMRHGQPCIVHSVGGLRDTVTHGKTGFVFDGDTQVEQADRFVEGTLDALTLNTVRAIAGAASKRLQPQCVSPGKPPPSSTSHNSTRPPIPSRG